MRELRILEPALYHAKNVIRSHRPACELLRPAKSSLKNRHVARTLCQLGRTYVLLKKAFQVCTERNLPHLSAFFIEAKTFLTPVLVEIPNAELWPPCKPAWQRWPGHAFPQRLHTGKSINPGNQQGPHAHSINVDKANKFAFCADLGIDKIMVYRLDATTGKLMPNDPQAFATPPGTGPRHFAFHPNGKTAYINGEINMTLIACDYDAAKGVLMQKQVISTLPKNETRKKGSTAEVVVHPSGKFVYVSNRDPYNSIAIFSIDPKTGEIKAIGHEARGVKTPRNFAIEPTGRLMLVANQSGKSVMSFHINQDTGELTPTGNLVEVESPVCVRFVPLTK